MRLITLGAWLRKTFDAIPAKVGSVSVLVVLAGLSAFTFQQQSALLERNCQPLPVSVERLEVTFSAARFQTLIRAEGKCAGDVLRSLISWDLLFPITYGLLLCALYLWVTRWRRFDAQGEPLPGGATWRGNLIAALPLAAAVLDAIFENLPLWYAGHALLPDGARTTALISAAVLIGSAGSLLKWILLLVVTGAFLIELGAGPRGAVLWRVRFSALAVVLGGIPLLAIPQGQDILQRLFEVDRPALALGVAVPPLILVTLAIWFCGRRILELRLPGTVAPPPSNGWYEYFGEQIPRILGVAFLAVVGTAFATAGLAAARFLGAGAAAFLAALLIRRYFSGPVGALGRAVVLRSWRHIPGFDERVGRLLIAGALGIFTFWPISGSVSLFRQQDAADDATILYLRMAAYLCAMAAWVFQLYVRFRREAAHAGGTTLPPRPLVNTAPLTRGVVLVFLMAIAVGVITHVAFTFAAVSVGRWVGPLWILALAASSAVVFGTASIWIGRRFRIPAVTFAIALAFMFSFWNDSHVVRVLPATTKPERPTIEGAFQRWARDLPGEGDAPVILVAGAGGGLRAAYWTAMSLAVLEDKIPGFGRHTFAISGVSGGSLGGALFAALLRDGASPATPCVTSRVESPLPGADGLHASCVREFMRGDHLSPVLGKLIGPDFLQLFLPLAVPPFDRAEALERSWEQSYRALRGHNTLAEGFGSLPRPPTRDAAVPLLFLNATHVETGRRHIASMATYRGGANIRSEASQFPDSGDVHNSLNADLPLSVAIHNSARFTYVSPAGHLDRRDGTELGHVVDGGYFENSGLATLREIHDIVARVDAAGRSLKVFVLYLCNDPRACGDRDGDAVASGAADELLSPVRALLNTRNARGSLSRAVLKGLGPDRFLELNVCGELQPAADQAQVRKTRDRVISPPLGWLLSKQARDWMDASLVGGAAGNDQENCYANNARVIDTLRRAITEK